MNLKKKKKEAAREHSSLLLIYLSTLPKSEVRAKEEMTGERRDDNRPHLRHVGRPGRGTNFHDLLGSAVGAFSFEKHISYFHLCGFVLRVVLGK